MDMVFEGSKQRCCQLLQREFLKHRDQSRPTAAIVTASGAPARVQQNVASLALAMAMNAAMAMVQGNILPTPAHAIRVTIRWAPPDVLNILVRQYFVELPKGCVSVEDMELAQRQAAVSSQSDG